ncbi:hypothetical protein ACO3VM_04805 [Methanocaldococcus sp. 10A]
MKGNAELKLLAENLRNIFKKVYNELKNKELTDRTLDNEVLNILKNFKISEETLEIKFSEPQDSIYRAEAGRTPYDLLCYGKINNKEFKIFINNKFGDLYSNARNDVTTYNNLLRLYLGISKQRLTSKITIDGDLIYKRVSSEEIVSYGVFVVDNRKRGAKFFLLEEIKDPFYINPRNNMFQIKYNPKLGEPMDYFTFCLELINAILESLEKSLNKIKTEIIVLSKIKEEIINIKRRIESV